MSGKSEIPQQEGPGSRVLVHKGGILNARVYRIVDSQGRKRIEKDFSDSPWLIRNTVGRLLVFREVWILRWLERTGVVPRNVERVSAFTFREDFCPGFTLRDSCCGVHHDTVPSEEMANGVPLEMLMAPIPSKFFEDLEKGIRAVHARGFLHLDLHNERNVIVGPDYRPVILDWQSALPLAKVPILGRLLARIDLAGVYKFHERFRPGELDGKSRTRLCRMQFLRRHFWVPRIRL